MRRTLDVAATSLSTADHRTETLVTGALLALGSVVAPVLGVVLLGYAVRVVRTADDAETPSDARLPAFDEWRADVLDGGRVALGALPLHLPGLAVLSVVAGVDRTRLVAPYLFSNLRDGVLPSLDLFAGLLAFAGLELLAGYLSVTVLVAVARRRSLGSEAAETALTVARSEGFSRAFSFALVVGTVGYVLGGALGAVPVLGGILSAGVSFLALVVAASVVGRLSPSTDNPGGRPAARQVDARVSSASADLERD